jgi:hypothetical protein
LLVSSLIAKNLSIFVHHHHSGSLTVSGMWTVTSNYLMTESHFFI